MRQTFAGCCANKVSGAVRSTRVPMNLRRSLTESNPLSGRRIEQMHAREVSAQTHPVAGLPSGFGRKPGYELEPGDVEEHERVGPQRLDHRRSDLDRRGIGSAGAPGELFRPQAE